MNKRDRIAENLTDEERLEYYRLWDEFNRMHVLNSEIEKVGNKMKKLAKELKKFEKGL